MNRLIAPALATVCGIATGMHSFNAPLSHDSEHVLLTPIAAVAAFQPELQKQAAEREGKNVQQFQQQHGGAIPPTKIDHETPDINNDKSIGAEVKQHLQDAKEEAVSTIQHAQQTAKTEVAPKKAWWGLGIFGASQGGEESPREDAKSN
ncbi:hypothetical protein E4T50_05968 [Aureobasidium sp. EXF-12298]|nr:hypothetical protein E4T50_05968 [Aureobasidium sp. EXF-12298]KAI4761236.1 hypothetical protein E4T51_05755 [Aureobasidium sp. EXF-12344]KAI4778396.1 hypothetical protein E4T52_06666 [Aureobasidium sp. EXF-3400]